MALSLRLRADRDCDLAGQVDADVRALPHGRTPALADGADPGRRRCAADLHVGREADAEQPSLLLRLLLLRAEALVADDLERAVERLLVVARVVLETAQDVVRGRVGEGVPRHEVHAPDLDRVEPELAGDEVDPALDEVGRLGPAGAAVGVDHARVRVDAEHLAVDRREPVRTGQHPAVERRRDAWRDRREHAAEVGVRLRLEGGDRAVPLRPDLEVRDVIAAVRRRDVVLAAGLDPLDGPADLLCERRHEHVLVVQEDLRPEPAANVERDAAHLRLGDPEDEGGHQEPHDVRVLGGHPDGVLPGDRVVVGRRAPHLHRRGDQPLVLDPLADDDVRLLQAGVGSLGVAAGPVHDDVAGGVLVDLQRAVRDGVLDIDDDVQRLPFDLDERERILGLLPRLGHDDRHTGAGEGHPVDLERPRRVDEVLHPAGLPRARQRRQVLEVLAGVHGDDAWRIGGRLRVDRPDAGVRVRRAEDRGVGHPHERQVVEVVRRAHDQSGVLHALDRLSDQVAGRLLLDRLGHAATSVPAAARTARTMFS